MKYRNDFVTNSSSSSFIVMFNSVAEMRESYSYLQEVCPKYADKIFKDIQNGKAKRKDVWALLKDDILYEAEYMYNEAFRDLYRQGYSIEEARKMLKGKTTEFVKKKKDEINSQLVKRGYIAIIDYDDTGAYMYELEQNVMPKLKFVFKTIRYH